MSCRPKCFETSHPLPQLLLAVVPLALVLPAIGPREGTVPMAEVVLVFALVFGASAKLYLRRSSRVAIGPGHGPVARHVALLPRAGVNPPAAGPRPHPGP